MARAIARRRLRALCQQLRVLRRRTSLLGRSTREIVKAARAEANNIDKSLKADRRDLPSGYSRACLAQALAKRDLIARAEYRVWFPIFMTLFAIPVIALSPIFVAFERDRSTYVSIFVYYLAFILITSAQYYFQPRSLLSIRNAHYLGHIDPVHAEKRPIFKDWLMGIITILYSAPIIAILISTDPDQLRDTLVTSLVLLLWAAIIAAAASPFRDHRVLVWLAPGAALVRALANAYAATTRAKPIRWRALEYRCKVAAEIADAAGVLEGPVLRRLAKAGASIDASSTSHLREAARALREMAAAAAVGGSGSRQELRVELGRALAAAAAGNLSELPRVQIAQGGETGPSRLARAAATAKGLFLAIAPAAGIAILLIAGQGRGWTFLEDAGTRTVLVQFAVLWLLVGAMSALDPTGYQQKLGAVTGAGGPLFNWSRGRA